MNDETAGANQATNQATNQASTSSGNEVAPSSADLELDDAILAEIDRQAARVENNPVRITTKPTPDTSSAEPTDEQRTLGAIMVGPPNAIELVPDLRPEDFGDRRDVLVFRAMRSLHEQGKPAGELGLIKAELDAIGVLEEVTWKYLLDLLDVVATSANLEHHAKQVIENHKRRRLGDTLNNFGTMFNDPTWKADEIAVTVGTQLESIPSDRDFAALAKDAWTIHESKPEDPDPICGDGLIVPGELALLVGAAGTGKTYALLDLALSFALGLEWYGFACKKSKAALLELENTQAEIDRRLMKIAAVRKLTPEQIQEAFENISVLCYPMIGKRRVNFAVEKHNITRWILNTASEVLLVDSMQRTHAGNELEEMPLVIEAYEWILDRTRVGTVALHHEPKAAGSPAKRRTDHLYASRGSTMLTDSAKTQMRLVEHSGRANKLALHFGKTNLGATPKPVWLDRIPEDQEGSGVLTLGDEPPSNQAVGKANLEAIYQAVAGSEGSLATDLVELFDPKRPRGPDEPDDRPRMSAATVKRHLQTLERTERIRSEGKPKVYSAND